MRVSLTGILLSVWEDPTVQYAEKFTDEMLYGVPFRWKNQIDCYKESYGSTSFSLHIKIVLTQENKAVLLLEKVYGDLAYKTSLERLAKIKAASMSIAVYIAGFDEQLHSEANAASFEYEDGIGGSAGVATETYTLSGQLL
jgi:hypothetical protein